MLAHTRQAEILFAVNKQGAAKVRELADLLAVSEMTVRRDIDALAEQGLLDKVHGGATSLTSSSSTEPTFSSKSLRESTTKDMIARQALQYVEPGMAIALSGGTTTYALARLLIDVPGITVVTNSIPAAETLHTLGRNDQTIVLTGGMRTNSDALVGSVVVKAMSSLHVDVLFMGVYGMSKDAGFTTPNLIEAETNQALIRSTRSLVVLADHTKWNTVGLSTIVPLAQASVIISDSKLPIDARESIREDNIDLILATSWALGKTS
jgi:DeoR/GlpR family transcriptional regulator of sugar metabolism